jgi:hypothetical protein
MADIVPGDFVFSGIVAFDLKTRTVKWERMLDQSSDGSKFKVCSSSSSTPLSLFLLIYVLGTCV